MKAWKYTQPDGEVLYSFRRFHSLTGKYAEKLGVKEEQVELIEKK